MKRVRVSLMAGAAALALALSSCSSSGGRASEETGDQTPTMTVAFISHGAPGDTFWDQVRKGAEDAAAKDNVKLEYTADPDGAKQANLVKQAVDKKVDGIAVTLAKPDAMRAEVMAAVEADIPVVGLNSGLADWKDMGISAFFGQDEVIAGQEAGNRLSEEKASKVLCVIHEQGNVGHEARCAGVAEKFPQTEKVYVKGTDMANVESTLTAKLQSDSAITHVLTLGAPFAPTALQSIEASGSKAVVTTFDINDEIAGLIRDGKIAWAVDQQPYVQGYMAVDSLWLMKQKGASVGGGQPVLTGPAFVDKSNVDIVMKG